jgi:hypothetical protein
MALKLKLTKDEHKQLPQDLQKEYVEKDGGYVLDVEGGVLSPEEKKQLNDKIKEFRDRNVEFKKQIDELQPFKEKAEKFGDLDPDETKALVEKVKSKGKGKGDANDIDEIVKSAVAAATKPIVDSLQQERTRREEAEKRAADEAFKTKVGEVARAKGARPGSLGYLINRAKEAFEFKDGEIVAKEGFISPDNAGNPLSTDEFFTKLAIDEAPLFEPSTGSGQRPGRPGTPGARVLRNPSHQEFSDNIDKIASGEIEVVSG